MASFKIVGNRGLSGVIYPQGAKNEALQVISTVLLTQSKVVIHNIPKINDVIKQIDLVQACGCEVEALSESSYSFRTKRIDTAFIRSKDFRNKVKTLRGSILLLGPLLARVGECIFPKPGGDKIGRRHIDSHLLAFRRLGADFHFNEKTDSYEVRGSGLKGNYILMEEASVTGTTNLVMLAVLTPGTTTLYNAACEPYIQQLCKMLNKMGAKISGLGSNLLTITGVSALDGAEHVILPDMIEVGSFIGMAAMTQSEITIKSCGVPMLGMLPRAFEKLGIELDFKGDDIRIPKQGVYEVKTYIDGSILKIDDAPWPALSPDLLSVILVVATQARGTVLIHQKMFESRLFFVDKLIDMGAKIILCDPHRATVIGLERKTKLRGISMTSPDIRAGISLLIAAMSAEGISHIYNVEQIDRGYKDIDKRLNALGASIERIS